MKLTVTDIQEELKKRIEENSNTLAQLKELNKKLEESENIKSNFLSNIRNELINPFASILGLTAAIQSCGPDQLDRVKQMAGMIHTEAFMLDFQLQNIFAAAEIEAGDAILNFTPVNVSTLFQSIIDTYHIDLQKNSLTVDFTCEGAVSSFRSDSTKLKLIFSNLLNNAIKFSQHPGVIVVSAVLEEKTLTFTIADKGIGIEEENLSVIFDRFKRINPEINSINTGYGLGLTVAKAMIEALNGNIEVHSKKEEGTLIVIQIPETIGGEELDGFSFSMDDTIFGDDDELF